MVGSPSEDARSLREEQLDEMSPLELADMADAGRGKLVDIDNKLKGKISGEVAAVLDILQIQIENENLWVGIDINGNVTVCVLLKIKNPGDEPLPLSELPGNFGIDQLGSEVCGGSMLRITFSLRNYIQAKRSAGGFGKVAPVAEGGEARAVVDEFSAQIRAADTAIAGPSEGREFSAEDVGDFLQKALGDRLAEDGGKWDVDGVTAICDRENRVVISGLNRNQRGTRWVKGVKSIQSIFELLAGKGYNALEVDGVFTVAISASEFDGGR